MQSGLPKLRFYNELEGIHAAINTLTKLSDNIVEPLREHVQHSVLSYPTKANTLHPH
jgi:hypothetical protein